MGPPEYGLITITMGRSSIHSCFMPEHGQAREGFNDPLHPSARVRQETE
jgi:hypothetical protein